MQLFLKQHCSTLAACAALWRPMAKKLEKAITAGQRFLAGLRTLPQFLEIQSRQETSLSKSLDAATSDSISESTSILEILDESLWKPEWLEDFKSVLASKTGVDAADMPSRAVQQDYILLPKYLTADLWEGLLQPEGHPRERMLEQLCKHAARLGLRNPSEASNAIILALVYGLTSKPELSVHDMADLLKTKRGVIKKFLQAAGKCALHLTVLPKDFVDLPSEFAQLAFADKKPAAAQREAQLESMMAMWPLRGTNKVLQKGSSSLALGGSGAVSSQMSGSDMGQFAASFATTFLATQANMEPAAAASSRLPIQYLEPNHKRQRLLALKDREPEEPPCALPSSADLPEKSNAKAEEPSRAVEDQKEQAWEQTAQPFNVSLVLDELKGAAKQGQPGQQALKGKPACSQAAAKKAVSKKPAAALKRPAAQARAASSDDKFSHHNFHAKVYGDCRVEFFSKKSYIRSWDYSQNKYVMIMGSCAGGIHKDVCYALLPHVKKGVSRDKLWEIRQDLMKKFAASS